MTHIEPLPPVIISGFSSQTLASDIATTLDARLADVSYTEFDDGEIRTELNGNVRGRAVVVIASAAGDPNTQEKETRLLMRSARETGAKSITLLLPYMFYGRSDSDFDARSTAGLADTISTFRDLCDQVVIVDPHNHGITKRVFLEGQCQTAVPLHFAYPYATQLKHLFNERAINKDHLLFALPDAGAGARITHGFKSCLYKTIGIDRNPKNKDWPIAEKARDHATGHSESALVGDFGGKDVVLFEDMVASAARRVTPQPS